MSARAARAWPWLAASLLLSVAWSGCGSSEESACGGPRICEAGERCFDEGEGCEVARRCARGPEATLYGRGAASGGGCVALSDELCAASTVACTAWGQCSAPPTGWPERAGCPAARTERDYQASRDPRCAGRGGCVALRDADCEAARVCALEGRCHAEGGICVARDPGACASSELCRALGSCSYAQGSCQARSAADCAGSEACEERGECAPSRGRCVSCRRSTGCARDGLCALVEGRCRATRPGHCQASRACKERGRCVQDRGRCVTGAPPSAH